MKKRREGRKMKEKKQKGRLERRERGDTRAMPDETMSGQHKACIMHTV